MVVIAKIMIATDRDRDSLRFDLPVRRSTRTPSRRSLSVSRHCSLHRRTATATANSPPLDYKDSSHIATQSERAAEFPFSISGRPLCSAPSVSSGLLSFPSAGAASVVGFAVCCILHAFSSAHPRSPPLLRLCSPPRGLLSLSSVAVAVVSPSARGVASGTAAAALLLRLLGEGALRC